jgi:hypothetical protein
MAFTQTDLDSLDRAIAGGELEVRLEGRQVKYRSTAELLQARSFIQQQVAAGASAATGRRASFAYTFTTQRG